MPRSKYVPKKTTKGKYKPKPKTTKVYKRRTARPKRMSGPMRSYVAADPFRPFYTAKLRYTQTQALFVATGGLFGAEQVFRLNSLVDPDLTGAGHQPYGFDSLAFLYNRYKVNAVHIQMVISNPNADGLVFAALLQPPGGTLSLAGKNPSRVKELPMAVTRVINNTGSQRIVINQYVPLHQVIGISYLQFKSDVDTYQAVVTDNPALCPMLRIACASNDTAHGSSQAITCATTLTFYSTFYDRVIQNQS